MKKTSAIKVFGVAAVLGLAMLFNTVSVYGQRENKRNGKNLPEGTLKEAKVVATLSTNVFEIQPQKIRLFLLNPTGKRATVGIRNRQNELIYFEQFFTKEYLRNFDLTTMLSGNYSLRVDNSKEHIVRPFVIQEVVTRNIIPAETGQVAPSNFLATISQTDPAKLRIHLNNINGKYVEITLRNAANEVVYRDFASGKQVSKNLQMSTLADGKYTLQVNNQDENLTRDFEITSARERSFAWVDKAGKPLKQDKATAFK